MEVHQPSSPVDIGEVQEHMIRSVSRPPSVFIRDQVVVAETLGQYHEKVETILDEDY